MSSSNPFAKLVIGFGVVFMLLITFSAGTDAVGKDADWFGVAIGIVTALFWVGIVGVTIWGEFKSLQNKLVARDRDIESMRHNKVAEAKVPEHPFPSELKELLDNLIEPLAEKAKMDAYGREMVRAIIEDTGGYPLTEDRIPAVEAAFHEQTDGYARVRLADEGKTLDLKFSGEPFTTEPADVPGRTPAHEAARKRGDAARAAEATKPLTKSQQRRINASKGHGAVTDEELKEQRNEARRAKRAAKKAAATTTTTTTQPGQTSLV